MASRQFTNRTNRSAAKFDEKKADRAAGKHHLTRIALLAGSTARDLGVPELSRLTIVPACQADRRQVSAWRLVHFPFDTLDILSLCLATHTSINLIPFQTH